MKLISEQMEALKERQVKFQDDHNIGNLKEVISAYEGLLNQSPENPEILFQYATAHLQLGHYGVAAQILYRSGAYWPDNPHLWSNLGCCYRSMHMLKRARECFGKSLDMLETPETFSNMAACFVNEDCPAEGIPYALKSMEMDPDNAQSRWNYSLLRLEMEEYAEGFKFYDAGLISGERQMRNYRNPETTPWWKGDKGTVAIWDEQGLGDRILFMQLLNQLKGHVDVILECHPRLEALYKRSFPWIEHIYPTAKKEHIEWPLHHKIDYKIALASLANCFWPENFSKTPYLIPNRDRVEYYSDLISKVGKPPYYGFSWADGAHKTNNVYRSMKLRDFKPLIERLGGTWISLQYHDWSKDKIEKFRKETGLPVYHFDEATLADDYDESVALAAALSHVVTVCTSMVHVCGAAGIPCTVLVPRKRAWRYPKGEHFHWYGDHIRQIHQVGEEPWSTMLERVNI